MVALAVVTTVILAFVCGLLLGEHLRPRPRAAIANKVADTGFLPWLKRAKTEPRQAPSISALPRYPGSWRKQRRDLERQHNSEQKERDQRVAPAL